MQTYFNAFTYVTYPTVNNTEAITKKLYTTKPKAVDCYPIYKNQLPAHLSTFQVSAFNIKNEIP